VKALADLETLADNFATKRMNCELLYQNRAHLMVVGVMKKHADSQSIQTDGCLTLDNIVHYNETCFNEVRVAGGIDVILAAMKTYAQEKELQMNGLGALL
jgi:hypothetical protein